MTLRLSNKYKILERLTSKYDGTDVFIAFDSVSGQIIKITYSRYNGINGAIKIEDVTDIINKNYGDVGQVECYHLGSKPVFISDVNGKDCIEYEIIWADEDDVDVGVLYIRVFYNENGMKYHGMIIFEERLLNEMFNDSSSDL